jgi:hydroxyacylglutathione hydrolase
MQVIQFRYANDNLGYLLQEEGEAIAIDPGDPGFVLNYLRENQLRLKAIRNTHSHFDHTLGNRILGEASNVKVADSTRVKRFQLGAESIGIIPTPGHTMDSVCFQGKGWVITGDTLFIANLGNCLPNLLENFWESLTRLLSLPEKTIIYPGHDYTKRSILRALAIEPKNNDIVRFWEAYNPPPIASTIGNEKRINPYLRTDQPAVIAYLEENGKLTTTRFDRFKSFLEIS